MGRKLVLSLSVMVVSLGLSLDAAAQKKEDILLAELKQIQAQLAQLQTSQAALKDVVDGLVARASDQQDSLRKTLADSTVTFGGAQAIQRLAGGRGYAAGSDPRKDGMAAGH